MDHQFTRHYTRDEARAMLPQVRAWLERLDGLRRRIQTFDQRLAVWLEAGADVGGETVNTWVRAMSDLQALLAEFQKREILIKDPDRGLVDFPAIIGGKEVLLCWEKGEEDIEFWHDTDNGYGGRERL